MGGFPSMHHRSAQNTIDHRVAMPAVQFPLGGFRAACGADGMDHAAGRHPGGSGRAERARAGGRGQRARFAFRARPGDRVLRNQAGRGRSARIAGDVFARIAGPGDAGAGRERFAEDAGGGGRAGIERPELAALRARAGPLFPQPAGGENRGQRDSAGGRVGEGAETAERFTEQDLTRYLQLSLDLFKDLQQSLQPRLHLEMGLLRMIHAGKLQPIEEALASLGSAGTPAAGGGRAARPAGDPRTAPSSAAPASGDLRSRLHAALIEAKQMHIADAVENSTIVESGSELIVTVPKMYAMYFKEAGFEAALKRLTGKTMKIAIKTGETAAAPVAAAPRADEVTERALSNPEVRRFQELFPDSHVR